ncbi:tyrosine-type recombinase/integrase [Massilia timonae]|jgi:integrase|uniref:tyrosine-type recombinase/integrase n=1 Tax=Massilia timonae TaxID=47229 RepID=UPI002354BED2|nr:tyrosine-type recombinase/integrase [Massilia timonae]
MNTFFDNEIVLHAHDGVHAELKAGQPAFFLESAGEATLFEEPTRFLWDRYVSAGSTPSIHTWSKAAYSLKSWFQFLQAMGKHWLDASAEDRRSYRDAYLSSISPRTGRHYHAQGVSDSMSVVRSFYAFARRKGWYVGDIDGNCEEVVSNIEIDRDAFADARSATLQRTKDRDLPKSSPNVVIHPLMVRDLTNLLNHVGPQATNRQADTRPARDRVICDLGWVVGLRLSEVISLTTLQFLSLSPDPSSPYTDLKLIVCGKGNKSRQVAIPTWLVLDVIEYIDCERSEALRAWEKRPRKTPIQLLLGRLDSPRRGQPISNHAIQRIMREACVGLGLVETVEKVIPETGEVFHDKVPKHSYHDLRHTCAVLMYHAEVMSGNPEPWKKIQAQLGHAHLSTTIDTYLAHVEIFTDRPGLLNVRKLIGL